jgi:hypothetical protein
MDFIEKPFVFYRFMRAFRADYFIEIRHRLTVRAQFYPPSVF